ncbi:889_t:CDS:2 [Acaulospora morrowiae]|uniref:889_t:CDS:1 n=1 Tax=Acaulospora morrowiae TaxID=94023 RepID=A0A9N9N943_9GLOM|nr:889_t:CDS:2 [Acaulospora morrowiae]
MSLVDETDFVSQYLDSLSSLAVKYPQDFAPPAQTRPRPPVRTFTGSQSKTGKNKHQVSKPTEGASIKVNVKSLKGGKVYTVQLSNLETVFNLKEKLQSLTSVSPGNQRLILKGKALVDTKTLSEYGIDNETTIHLVQKVAGSNSEQTASGSTSESSSEQNTSSLQHSQESHELPPLSAEGAEKVKDPQFLVSMRTFLREQFSEGDADRILHDFEKFY